MTQGLVSVLGGGTGWTGAGYAVPPSRCALYGSPFNGGPVDILPGPTLEVNRDPTRGSPPDTTWASLLQTLCGSFGWVLRYGADGDAVLYNATDRLSAGYTLSATSALGGAVSVPWERLRRALTQPDFTRVEVWGAPPLTPVPLSEFQLWDSATSTHSVFPHAAPSGRTEYLQHGGSAGARLAEHLRKADQLTVTVDAACPVPPPGEEVFVSLPDDQIAGAYALQSASVPLGTGPATWTLGYMGAAW